MIAMKEKVIFEMFALDFYILLQTYQDRLVSANQCPFNSCSAVLSVKQRNSFFQELKEKEFLSFLEKQKVSGISSVTIHSQKTKTNLRTAVFAMEGCLAFE